MLLTPKDLNLLKSQMEVENKLKISKFELTDVVEVKTTADEGMAFSNSWCTYHERTDCLVWSRGKVYSLVLGQCTTVLLDKMKQDAVWQVVSDSYNPLKLLKLIEKIILKQSDNQYKIAIIMEQLKLLLAYCQDDGVTNAAYYDQFKTRVDVAEHIGVSFNNTTHPEVAMALKSHKAWDLDLRSVWFLDNQSIFDLCYNPDFAHKWQNTKRATHLSSNGGGLCISKECKVLGCDFWVWFTKRVMTNILCLKNLICLY